MDGRMMHDEEHLEQDSNISDLSTEGLFRKLISWYKEDVEHVNKWREQAREDFRFYNGDQWNEADLAALKEQRRPVMTFNRIAPLVNAVVGSERNNKREVQFIPRQIGKALPSELLTGAAEWFRDMAHAEYADSDAFQDAVICGMGWTDTRLDYENNLDGEPVITRLDPLKMVWDSAAVQPNLTDAQRMWYVDRKPLEVARQMFPKAHWSELSADWARDGSAYEGVHHNDLEAYDDERGIDVENGRRMVTLVECRWFESERYYKAPDLSTGELRDYSEEEFKQLQCMMPQIQGAAFNKKVVKRAFLGRKVLLCPDQPMVPAGQLGWECITGYFDKIERQFYGVVRPTKDPQRWANKYFSQVMHILNSQSKGGIMAERGAFEDEREAVKSWSRADSITVLKNGALAGGKIQPKPVSQFPTGFFQLFNEAKEAINQVTGLSPEFIGTREVSQAGILEAQRRQSSLNLLACLFDGLRLYRKRQGKLILHLIQNYLSDGRLVRISGEENAQYIPLTREAVMSVDYDIVVDDAPTSPNEKERTFGIITQLLPLLQNAVTPDIMLDLLRYSPLPASLLNRVSEKMQQQQQMAQQAQQQMNPEQEMKLQEKQQDMATKSQMQQMDLQGKQIELFMRQKRAELEAEIMQQKHELERERILNERAQNQIMRERAATYRGRSI
ncbi:phage portal protein [Bartonella krasnovii]|uniref:portal protein n=1 Tax=Bartonella krasnovii TaxID=2267275 RepID=UPI001F4CC1AF|nr:portal protein [Bartonella krasnovii]UNF49322.1 phage portal protein [Bartonella krasnovii]